MPSSDKVVVMVRKPEKSKNPKIQKFKKKKKMKINNQSVIYIRAMQPRSLSIPANIADMFQGGY